MCEINRDILVIYFYLFLFIYLFAYIYIYILILVHLSGINLLVIHTCFCQAHTWTDHVQLQVSLRAPSYRLIANAS